MKAGASAVAFSLAGDKVAVAFIDPEHTIAVWDTRIAGGSLIGVSQAGLNYIFDLDFKSENVFKF